MPAGIYTTGTLDTNGVLVRAVGREIGLVEPDENPLVTLLSYTKDGPVTPQTKFEFFEDDFLPRFVTVTGAGALIAATTIPLVDSSPLVVGDMLVIPAAANSANQPERIIVTAINRGTHVITVQRAVGGVGAMAVPANHTLRIMSGAYGEGSDVPESVRTTPYRIQNYTQIYKKTVDWTRTAQTVQVYGMPNGQMPYDEFKLMKEMKRAINGSLLFGVPSENLTGSPDGYPIRTTGGLLSRITSNKLDMGGSVTFDNFMAGSNSIFRYGTKQKVLLCCGILFEAFHAWALKKLLSPRTETKFGMRITSIETPYGTFLCVLDRSLENTSGVGFGNMALAVDIPYIQKRVLAGNGKNAELAFYRDVKKDGRDRTVNYAMGEWGWEIKQEKYHALMYNITGFTNLT